MADLAKFYWDDHMQPPRQDHVNHLCEELWTVCRRTFWPRETLLNRFGPDELDDEFDPDTFLLHFLAEMRNQLEHNPR